MWVESAEFWLSQWFQATIRAEFLADPWFEFYLSFCWVLFVFWIKPRKRLCVGMRTSQVKGLLRLRQSFRNLESLSCRRPPHVRPNSRFLKALPAPSKLKHWTYLKKENPNPGPKTLNPKLPRIKLLWSLNPIVLRPQTLYPKTPDGALMKPFRPIIGSYFRGLNDGENYSLRFFSMCLFYKLGPPKAYSNHKAPIQQNSCETL